MDFRILVLDSGSEGSRSRSADLVGSLKLDVEHLTFPGGISPFEKFWRGSLEVRTEFCALCGDDDVVLLDGLPRLVGYLGAHPDFAAAQGGYFTFHQGRKLDITSLLPIRVSMDQPSTIERLQAFFDDYQAVTYSVYRSSILQVVLGKVQPLDSLLGQELLSGALTVVEGKIAHLPLLYYGRSLGPSASYKHWHPLEWLVDSPDDLFRSYVTYRALLVDAVIERGSSLPPPELSKLIDYLHLSYLSPYLRPDLFDYLGDQLSRGASQDETLEGLWPRLEPSGSSLLEGVRRSRGLRRLRDRWLPGLRLRGSLSLLLQRRGATLRARTARGRVRKYRLSEGIVGAALQEDRTLNYEDVQSAIRQLSAYE